MKQGMCWLMREQVEGNAGFAQGLKEQRGGEGSSAGGPQAPLWFLSGF